MKRFLRVLWLLTAVCVLTTPSAMGSTADESTNGFYEDYVWLWEQLNENYPYIRHLNAVGMDTVQIQKDYAGKAQQCGDLKRFLDLLSDMFGRMDNFAHLTVLPPSAFEEYCELARIGVLERAYADKILDEETLKAYASISDAPENGEYVYPLVETAYYEQEQAIYFRFHTFNHLCIERDSRVIEDALAAYPQARHVILDITGNRGGSDYYWIDNIVAPFEGEYQYENILYFRDTPLTREFGLMDAAVELDALQKNRTIPESVRNLGMTHAVVSSVCYPEPDSIGQGNWADVKRWVLIDDGVYSAADGFVSFCKETGWASLIGDRTMGDGGSAAPLMVQLPNTKLLVQFSCAATVNSDGTLNAVTGTLPDYMPKPRETALTACLRLIRTIQ